MRIALQPAALNDPAVLAHYEDTIDRRVPFNTYVDLVDPPDFIDLKAHFPEHTAQFWGATPGRSGTNVSKWERLEPGDAVFFYGEKRLYLAGRVALPFRSEDLADRLWGRNQEGLTWELMYALTDLRDIFVPIQEIRAVLGWSDKAFVQGFTVFDGEKADRLAELVNLDSLPRPSAPRSSASRTSARSSSVPDGPTDGTRTSSWRREHPALKQRLIDLSDGTCALCGNRLPSAFLVGAHIKRRSACSEDERKDFDHIGMLACLLGCDSLFERGFIAVDHGGAILISNAVDETPDVAQFIKNRLAGRTSTWWSEKRETYFAWHREHIFIRLRVGAPPASTAETGSHAHR